MKKRTILTAHRFADLQKQIRAYEAKGYKVKGEIDFDGKTYVVAMETKPYDVLQ